jgi:(R,R)-butanediol dehydrogenase/meso-butanediol dehydrogenase/diacetyl reductase
MLALRLHGIGDLRVEQVPRPEIAAPGQVRLAIRAAGICGSDLHNFRTGMWISKLPVTPGHEFCAEVLESADENFTAGDLVVADSRAWCGHCRYCAAGAKNLCATLGFVGEVCDGGFAEQTVLPGRLLFRLPRETAPDIAAMAEPLAVARHAIHRLRPTPGAAILIAGGGPIGGLIALLLRDAGFGPLFIAERNGSRAALIAGLTGATIVALQAQAIAAACPGGPPFAVDATGAPQALEILLEALPPGSRLALVGLFHGRPGLDINRIVEREIECVGCSVFVDEMQQILPMLPRLAPQLSQLAGPPISLAAAPAAYEKLIAGETAALKTLIRP